MMKMVAFLSAIVLLAFTPVAPADETDLSGNWKMSTESSFGKQEGELTLKQSPDGKLEGTYKYEGKETAVSGQLTGDQVELNMKMETRGGTVDRTLSGTVQEKTLSGTFKVRGGEGKWSATRL